MNTPPRILALTTTVLCLAVAGCGGDDEKKTSDASSQESVSIPTTTPAKTTQGGLQLADVKACLTKAGVKAESVKETYPGEEGYLKVPLGAGQFEDPSAAGAFKFYGHVLVYDTPRNAKLATNDLNEDRFKDGELRGNAYIGFNTEKSLAPKTKNGEKFLACVES